MCYSQLRESAVVFSVVAVVCTVNSVWLNMGRQTDIVLCHGLCLRKLLVAGTSSVGFYSENLGKTAAAAVEGSCSLFSFFSITFLKVPERLFLKVLEEIQPESLLQTVAVVSEETLQPIPAGGQTKKK